MVRLGLVGDCPDGAVIVHSQELGLAAAEKIVHYWRWNTWLWQRTVWSLSCCLSRIASSAIGNLKSA